MVHPGKYWIAPWTIAWLSLAGLAMPGAAAFADEPSETKSTAQTEVKAQTDGAKQSASVDPNVVPEGNAEELEAYISALRKQMVAEQRAAKTADARRAVLLSHLKGILAASDKILALPDLSEEAKEKATSAKWSALGTLRRLDVRYADQFNKMAQELAAGEGPTADQARGTLIMNRATKLLAGKKDETLADDVIAQMEKNPTSGVQLGSTIGRYFEMAGNVDEAKRIYEAVDAAADKIDNAQLADRVKKSNANSLTRLSLLGTSPTIEGTTFGGEPLDWSNYKGKVVLIDFWATWCGPCIAELPNVKKAYEKYHDKGFEIVGISLDTNKESLAKFLEKEEIPWATIFEEDSSKQGFQGAPHVQEFGVNGIPATYLIDRDGKVVSISARGPRLEQQLEQLLGGAE